MQICPQVQKLLINQSGYRRVPFWETGLRKSVLHTTVLQQLQSKMPVTVIKHHILPLKVVFLNRIMPEAPDFDENQKSMFLTCRSKIIALCIATEYQCNSFWAVGSPFVFFIYILYNCFIYWPVSILTLTRWEAHNPFDWLISAYKSTTLLTLKGWRYYK